MPEDKLQQTIKKSLIFQYESLYSPSVWGHMLCEVFFFLLKGVIPIITITYYVIMFKVNVFCILPVLLLHSVTKIVPKGLVKMRRRNKYNV